jgi:hypothetical protein
MFHDFEVHSSRILIRFVAWALQRRVLQWKVAEIG